AHPTCELCSSNGTIIGFVDCMQGEQPPQKKGKGTMSWRGPRFREAICRVFQLGEEEEFKAEVEEEGYAVTVVGDDIMPNAKELWALLTMAMHYARIIFKESALNPDGTLQIVPGEVQGTTVSTTTSDAS
ncbi:hypothetical protein, partial [Bosea sp. (in: a-proteobacteria)]|uniref:hypothetical protein n=1 Tax=Bosea sp. (in: a-proteobacteria) TaxID=1871050 RepID=UPI004033B188